MILTVCEIIFGEDNETDFAEGQETDSFQKRKIVDEEEAEIADVVAVLKMPMNDLQDEHVGFGSSPAVGVEEYASRSSNPAVNDFNRSNVVSSFFPLKASFGCREFNGWYCPMFGNCNMGDEVFDAALHYFLTFFNLGVFLDGHE